MKKIYLIPGLGADESVYAEYAFPGFDKTVIRWEEPIKNESLANYANRLISQISGENPIILGVSFGGMLAVEIGNRLTGSKVVLISSVISYREISAFKRFLAKSGIIRFIPDRFLTKPNQFLLWLFGVRSDNHKRTLSTIIRNTSPAFLKWAIVAIGKWKGQSKNTSLFSVHGSRDLILPLKHKANYVIKGSGHFIVAEYASQVEQEITRYLKGK